MQVASRLPPESADGRYFTNVVIGKTVQEDNVNSDHSNSERHNQIVNLPATEPVLNLVVKDSLTAARGCERCMLFFD